MRYSRIFIEGSNFILRDLKADRHERVVNTIIVREGRQPAAGRGTELRSQLREKEVVEYGEVKLAKLEGDGRLSVIKVRP